MSSLNPLRLAAAASLLALTTGLASAQNPDLTKNPENTGRAPTATEATKKNDDLKEWQVAKSAKTSLAQAIATAEGKAVEYEIKVALMDREQEIKVGPDGMVKND